MINEIVKWTRSCRTQTAAAVAASWSMLGTGLVLGWSSPAIPSLNSPGSVFDLSEDEIAWLAAVSPLSGLLGSLVVSVPLKLLGRRSTLMLISIPFIAGFYAMGLSHYLRLKSLLYLGRVTTGIASGASSLAAQIYITECSLPAYRGVLGSLPATFLSFGILLAYIIGALVEWHVLSFILGTMGFLLTISMSFMPETPFWLLGRNREKDAHKSLEFLRDKDCNLQEELDRLYRNLATIQTTPTVDFQADYLKALLQRQNLLPFLISMAVMFFQHFSGTNVVIFYTVTIFRESGSTINRWFATIIVGIVRIVSTVAANCLVDRYGRKVLLIVSGIFMWISLAAMGVYFYLKDRSTLSEEDVTSTFGWLPLVSLMVYVMAFAIGYGILPFLVMGELLPSTYRNLLGSISTSFNFLCAFVVVLTFSVMSENLGQFSVFWFYSSWCLVGVAFVAFCLPETKGKTLEDIALIFTKNNSDTNTGKGHENKAFDNKY